MPLPRSRLAALMLACAFVSALASLGAYADGHADASAGAPRLEIGASPGEDVVALAPGGLEAALADLPDHIAEVLELSGVPGLAVAVVHGGETVYAAGFGVRERGQDAPVEPETVFQVASVSKPLAATVAAIAVTQGLVSWDDRVRYYLPDFEFSDLYVTAYATIGDLFAHRSGLPGGAGDDLEDIGYGRNEIIARLRLVKLDAFRASYHYANFGITIGAEAVAAAAGMEWEVLAETALYGPLGMDATSSRHADYLGRDNRAVLHAPVEGGFEPLYERDPDAQSPAGGVSSNVLDLAEWLKLLLAEGAHRGETLIAPEALLPALSPQAASAPPSGPAVRPGSYGYGFNVGVGAGGRTVMSHSGAFLLGAGTHIRIVPSADTGIVVLTNGGPVGVAEAVSERFFDIVQYGAPTRDWYAAYHGLMAPLYDPVGDLVGLEPPADAAEARPLEHYAGRYGNPYFGDAEIVREGDGLVLVLGPREVRVPLEHWDGDTFAAAPLGENAPPGSLSSVWFEFVTPGPDANAFTVEYLDGNELATWHR